MFTWYLSIIAELSATQIQHKAFNDMLNKLEGSHLERTKQLAKHKTEPLRYQHSYLVDSFYNSDVRDGEKIRVTRDEKTNEVRECVKKIRLGNLDIYSPKYNADWRVSVNFEVPGTPRFSQSWKQTKLTFTFFSSTPSRKRFFHPKERPTVVLA